MSFMVMPSERESGEIMGGGQWANEYSYKNPTTGEWEYSSSPRTYGDNGNLTYEEWMKSLGREPGSYGPSASDYLYNEWLKSVTPKGKLRANGMGEQLVGTKPNEAITSKASQLGESQATTANEESHSTSEDKGTDYSWITSATEEALPEQESEYPNGMSEEEFNDYYTFAYGMTHGTPWNLDDEGEKMPYYGDIEMPSDLAERAKFELDNYTGADEDYKKELQEEYDKYNNYAKTLSDFVEKYKDKYKGPDLEKEENKKEPEESKAFKEAEDKYYKASDDLDNAREALSKFALENGIDPDTNITETPFYKGYREFGSLDTRAGTATLGKGKTTNIKDSTTGAETKVTHNNDDSWTVVTSNGTEFTGKGNGTNNTAVGLGLSGEVRSPDSAFGKAMAIIGGPDVKDYFGDSYNGKGIIEFRQDVINAAKAAKVAEEAMENARVAEAEAMSSKSKDEQKEIMDAYASGKMNAVQAANALARAQASGMIDFDIDSVMSNIPAESFKAKEPIGKVGETAVGKDTFVEDIETPKTAEPVITKFEHLNEIKEELGKVDISKVTNVEEAKEVEGKITAITKNAVEVANRDFITIYKELVNEGVKAKDLASNPRVKEHSQEAFGIGQDIYEKYSELEAKTNELGLTPDKLNKKYINKNINEISLKVAQLDPEKTKITGSYYSPGSNMNGTNTSQPTGITLSKEQVKALVDYANDVQCGKDAGLAIMKSAAFNGAENVEGGKYVEEWKNAKALETGNFKEGAQEFVKDKGKLTWKDYFAAGVKGTLGTVVAILGGAVTAVNPILGIMLMTVGTASAGKAGLQITTDVVRSKSTNKEMMFGSGEGGKDVFRDIYNRVLEPANIGDAKSVGTYINLGNGAVSIVAGLVELIENPVIGIEAIRSGVEDINKAGNGGLSNNLDTGVKNIYDLGVDISTFLDRNDLKPEALGLTENLPTFIPNVKDKRIWNGDYTVYADTKNNATDPAAASEYGSAESSEELSEEEKAALDTTYSGAREQAKNSNLATDYNAGMEQEVNEAVSDKYAKVFKVMIDKEPDYIRKVLIAIPKIHSEREW